MQPIEAVYLSGIAVGMCILYIVLFFSLQKAFKNKTSKLTIASLRSLAIITILSLCVYIFSFYILSNEFWGNRFLHAFGGGVMVFLTCLFVVRDTHILIHKSQFFILAFVIMFGLGIVNEIAEFVLQQITDFTFAPSLNDTMLDVVSNTIGFMAASVSIMPHSNGYLSSQKRSVNQQ